MGRGLALTRRRVLPWLLACVAGMTLALALPGLSWWPLVLVFPGLFLAAIEETTSWPRAFLIAGCGGVVHWLVATWWVVAVMHDYGGLSLPAAVVCALVMALILGFSWGLVGALTVRVGPWWRPWLFPVLWIVVEAARQLPPYLFPWNPTAAACAGAPWMLASLPVWGASGLGWALVGAGAAGYAWSRGSRRAAVMALASVLALTLGASLWPAAVRPTGVSLRVALIQPGTGLAEKWDPRQWQEIMDQLRELSVLAAGGGVDLILWPESAVPLVIERDVAYRAWLTDLAAETGASIVVNSVGFTAEDQPTNSVYLVDERGVRTRRYDKLRLVPFGEYVPTWAKMAFTEGLVREVGSFVPGRELVLLDARAPLGMALCYEVVFADLVAAQVRAGAQVLSTITNDGWYGDSWAPPQHFAQAVLRAAENRRFMLRAALTGISGVVDPRGRVRKRLEVGEVGFLVDEVRAFEGTTLRTRFGDWWAVLCAASALVMLVVGRLPRVPESNEKMEST